MRDESNRVYWFETRFLSLVYLYVVFYRKGSALIPKSLKFTDMHCNKYKMVPVKPLLDIHNVLLNIFYACDDIIYPFRFLLIS